MWIRQGYRPLVGLGLSCWLGMCCSPWGELLLWEKAAESFGGVPWPPREKMSGGGAGVVSPRGCSCVPRVSWWHLLGVPYGYVPKLSWWHLLGVPCWSVPRVSLLPLPGDGLVSSPTDIRTSPKDVMWRGRPWLKAWEGRPAAGRDEPCPTVTSSR